MVLAIEVKMFALRKLLLIIALLFSSAIAIFFDPCLLCSILRLTLFVLILIPPRFERTILALETSGLFLSFILSWLENPLFCTTGCNTLLSIIPLFSFSIFLTLFCLRALSKKEEPAE